MNSLVAASAAADGTRSFNVPAADINTWLVSSVTLEPQSEGIVRLDPQRVYAVPGHGDLRLGLETKLTAGLHLYFEGCYVPAPAGDGTGLVARRFSVGRLPLPSVAGWLVKRQFDGFLDSLAGPLAELSSASHIGISPETVTLRWSGRTR